MQTNNKGRYRWNGATPSDATNDNYIASVPSAAFEVNERISLNQSAPETTSPEWSKPLSLIEKVDPKPYPLDALPPPIRAAVKEVVDFVKAPVPMVASSALAAISLACQAHADVKRLEELHGPVGLYMLVIADSGERKSTCDGFFAKPISDYEKSQDEAAKLAWKDYQAAIEAWEAKRGGVKESIRNLAKEQKSTADMESALRDLEHDKPLPPRIPRLLYADATPEALAYGLAKQWPSGGVVSAEAGIVLGSHGMGKDSVMRNLGLLNQLWEGKSLTIDRRTTESFTVRGARLTVALQVQEPTLREFFNRSGALARGTGFLARFLVAWPESTQGMRQIDPDAPDGPATWTHLAAFHQRLAAILDQPVPIDENGALTPPMLSLTPEAKAAWIEYHNTIESELSHGGELYHVRDVASKSADNAARLAALFQLYEGAGGAISLAAFESASQLAVWHLHESLRFFGELALPAELADATRLEGWLIKHCQINRTLFINKNHVRQRGPLREGGRLEAAIKELVQLDRLRLEEKGNRRTIKVNPALMIAGGPSRLF
jgi:putative DNA primase/helicase